MTYACRNRGMSRVCFSLPRPTYNLRKILRPEKKAPSPLHSKRSPMGHIPMGNSAMCIPIQEYILAYNDYTHIQHLKVDSDVSEKLLISLIKNCQI